MVSQAYLHSSVLGFFYLSDCSSEFLAHCQQNTGQMSLLHMSPHPHQVPMRRHRLTLHTHLFLKKRWAISLADNTTDSPGAGKKVSQIKLHSFM